ncbi:MAG: YfiR/HmsC family protein [Bacteroidales bacterium]|jgi:serine phosphatase RsbU (regulator of sigma subunit)|nr:YfiR/HmsC family protein [Bacteroidales bacterium]
MKYSSFWVLVLIIFTTFKSISAQETFTDKKRAQYIFSFSEYVSWKNSETNEFSIGILSQDSLLYYMLKQEAAQKQNIHNKPIDIKLFSSIESISPTQVIFLKNSKHFSIEDVHEKIDSQATLLLTENFPFHKSMINFIVLDGNRKYEINVERLANAGLTINPLLVEHAVKTKEDWEELYKKTEQKLHEEQLKTKKQTKLISIQVEDIKKKEQEISELQQSILRQKKALAQLNTDITKKQEQLNTTLLNIANRQEEINIQKLQLDKLNENITKQQQVLRSQSDKLHTQDKKIVSQFNTIEQQHSVIIAFILFFIIILILGYIIYRQYKLTQKINKELAIKNTEVSKKRDMITEQHKHITDSIVYARRIQHAILPPENIIAQNIPNHFILFKPRDIVSGDYYWMTQIDDLIVITAADCTGHGVPGAFMSLLGITFLNEIVHEKNILEPHLILNELRLRIINSLNKQHSEEEYKDGMDMAICLIDKKQNTLSYSGAHNPLYIIRNGELEEIKADRMPVGLSEKMDSSFQVHKKTINPGDAFYIFSDGYADQFGGPDNKKFMARSFKKLLLSIHEKEMEEQKSILDSTITEWRGDTEQIDDILIIGLKM